jgi:hypothetical protein
MTDSGDKMLERVRALLAKAESTDFPAEAEALTAKAQELMARHAIDEAMLAQASGRSDEVAKTTLHLEGWYYMKDWTLLTVVARANGCDAVGERSRWKKDPRTGTMRAYSAFCSVDVHVYGTADDRAKVELLFTSLLVQAAAAAQKLPTPYDTKRQTFLNSFLDGFAVAVNGRLRKANVEAAKAAGVETDGTGQALVLVSKSEAVQRAIKEDHGKTKKAASRGSSSAAGFFAGKAAGEKASFGTKAQSMGGGEAKALGQ